MTASVVLPWRGVWRQPRATVREQLANGNPLTILVLPATSGIVEALLHASANNFGARAGAMWILLMAAWAGGLWGLLRLHMVSGVIYFLQRLGGDTVPFARIRTAISVSSAPLATAFLFWVTASITVGRDVFISPDALAASLPPSLLLQSLLLYLATVVCAVWSLIVLVIAVAEVLEISAGQAVLTLVIGYALLAAAVLAAVLVVAAIMG
ncbi:MAG TPA: YIP1 family protein [Gemmatimonadales bacterium]|nr:YIP1 family protein [Gemmatimonadales bacterium]